LAIHLFEEGKLSFGKARSLAAMTIWEFQQLLGNKGIVVHYDTKDYVSVHVGCESSDFRSLGRNFAQQNALKTAN